jgi:hypothetical protein
MKERMRATGLPKAPSAQDVGADSSGRSLIHIPVIHTEADMGALSRPIKKLSIEKLGEQGWERNVSLIEGIWTRIEDAVNSWSLPYSNLRLYQDGLPVCGREVEIVRELAKTGSRNHRLLLSLMERGAALMGTESAALLVQEYQLVKQILDARDSHQALELEARYKASSQALLAQRDKAIGERINSTLGPGETGLLFLGMLHTVEKWLAKDIRVIRPAFPPAAPDPGER